MMKSSRLSSPFKGHGATFPQRLAQNSCRLIQAPRLPLSYRRMSEAQPKFSERAQAAQSGMVYAGGIESSDNISPKEAGGLRRLGWVSFWTQLALSIVSAVVLFFTANTAAKGNFPQLPVIFNVFGVVAGFISTFLAFTKTRIARGIIEERKTYSKSKVANDVLNATRLNLLGLGATIVALQSTVGGLVGKALTSSSTTAYNVQAAQNAPAALDVFAVQASTNTILLHFLAILFSNFVLRILNQSTRAAAT